MAIFESLFDITYLSVVIALGIRLLIEKTSGAKLFGVMAIILGIGDSFHLIPRIISHLSPLGFDNHSFALSWGQFVASITMTIFYLMYYHYYVNQSNDKDSIKKIIIYVLAVLRIALVLAPQNKWGDEVGDYMFKIYRNIPFTIMGILLIYLTYKQRDKNAFKYSYLLIFLSFLFYIPVVLWSDSYPIVGMFMLPKTVAYLMIVVFGYRFFVKDFSHSNILGMAFTTLLMGLIGGVFYREFTKFYDFKNVNHLGKLHVHLFALGFLLTMIVYVIVRNYKDEDILSLKKPFYIYMAGLTFTIVNMMVFGIYEVVSQGMNTISLPALSGMSGLGHITLSIGLVYLFVNIFNIEKNTIKNSL